MSDEISPEIRREKLLLGGATVLVSVLPIALPVAPVPLAVLVRRHGMRAGVATAVISGVAALLFSLNPLVFVQVLLVLALGIAIGEGLKERLTVFQLVIGGTGVAIITTFLLKVTIESVIGEPLDQLLVEFWQEVLTGTAGSGTDIRPDSIDELVAQMRAVFPAGLVLGSLAMTIINIALATRLLKRFPPIKENGENGGKVYEPLPPFGLWRFHRALSIAFVIGWLVGGGRSDFDAAVDPALWTVILANMMLVIGTVVTVHGMAVCWHFLRRARVSALLSAIVLMMAFFMPIIPVVLLVVGLVDGWIDLRRVNQGVLHG